MLLALWAASAAACSDGETCGPGDEEAPGLIVESITFGELRASPNNDCPPTNGEHPVAITIEGHQVDPAADGQFLVFCLPRPDLIDDQPVSFTDTDRLQLVDLFGRDANDCELRFDRTAAPGSGTATFSGFCDNGTASEGFALSLTGVLPFTRSCDGEDPVDFAAALGGRAEVAAAPL